MSAVIKSAMLAAAPEPVRSFAAPAEGDAAPRQCLLEARIATLEAEIAARDQALPKLIEEARAEGARDALEQRSDAEDKALSALEAALRAAGEAWSGRLDNWGSAAAGIAREVLAQVFAGRDGRAELVEAAIAARLTRLDAQSLVRVRVSAEDLEEGPNLRQAAARLGAGLDLMVDPGIGSGGCVIDLKLGSIDVGLTEQWHRIEELMDRIEREGLVA